MEFGCDLVFDLDFGIVFFLFFLKRKWILFIMDCVGFFGMFGLCFVLNIDVNMLCGLYMM